MRLTHPAVRLGAAALGWLGFAAVVGVAVLRYLDVTSLPAVAIVALTPWLMPVGIGAIALTALARNPVATLCGVAATASLVATQVPLIAAEHPSHCSTALTAMHANLLFDGATPQSVLDAVKAHRVDVLTVNELTRAALVRLTEAGLDRALPYRNVSPGQTASGTGIWSRFPLTNSLEYDGYVLNQLSATMLVPDVGRIRVAAFHPVPPVYDTAVWRDELHRLQQIVRSYGTTEPLIVGGDFNATYDHVAFRAFLGAHVRDAVEQSGAGYQFTYPTDKGPAPFTALDHILVGRLVARDTQTVQLRGADHRALVARLTLCST